MPYVQNPKELLQKSPNAIQRINQTDLNVRMLVETEHDKTLAKEQALLLIEKSRELNYLRENHFGSDLSEDMDHMTIDVIEGINLATPESEEGKALVYEQMGKMANIMLEKHRQGEDKSQTLQAINDAMSLVSPPPLGEGYMDHENTMSRSSRGIEIDPSMQELQEDSDRADTSL